jgi:Txe/YoeB family toxin of Txe-Axe toxin-antitoxin module
MAAPRCSDEEFIRLFENAGAGETARHLGLTKTDVFERRRRIERRLGKQLTSAHSRPAEHEGRLHYEVKNGTVLVGSDAHYWPDIITTAHRGFVKFCKELKPKLVIMNGDILDGASISRHPPIGWENRPTLIQEIEASQERLEEIRKASEGADHVWPLGNHDARFSTRLATVAPEYARVHGTRLRDHFPEWSPCWSVWINESVVVKHRAKGGLHAVHNNTVQSGLSMVTGHLHSLKVSPWSDYHPRPRFGVDTGTLAATYGPQFQGYMEDGFRNWRSGFAVLTFHEGELLWPELVHVRDEESGTVEFRGKVYRV